MPIGRLTKEVLVCLEGAPIQPFYSHIPQINNCITVTMQCLMATCPVSCSMHCNCNMYRILLLLCGVCVCVCVCVMCILMAIEL